MLNIAHLTILLRCSLYYSFANCTDYNYLNPLPHYFNESVMWNRNEVVGNSILPVCTIV
jgi:hypothetical protein